MSKIRIKLDAWSEAELDLIEAREIVGMLSSSLFNEGLKHESDVAFAVERRITSALKHIESGRE